MREVTGKLEGGQGVAETASTSFEGLMFLRFFHCTIAFSHGGFNRGAAEADIAEHPVIHGMQLIRQ